MKSLSFSLIVLASFATLFSVADAYRFYVGGNGAWVINPHESYNTWAERNRFQVNDTLYFKYAKGSDSVQRVMKADFDGCNIRDPLEKFDNGEAEVTLNRSGPFYFISGNQEHCMKGQKLIVVVLAVRHHPKVPISPAKAPSTLQPPKAHSPVSPPAKAPSTVQPPKSHSPVSSVPPVTPPSTSQPPKSSVSPSQPSTPSSPAVSPSHAPTISPATHSPPSKSPSPSTASPKIPPSSSPSPKSPSPASSPSSSTSSPAKPPTSSPSPDDSPASPAPDKIPPLSPTSSNSPPTADNITAPAPSPKNAATGVVVTSVLTTLLSVTLTVLMFA